VPQTGPVAVWTSVPALQTGASAALATVPPVAMLNAAGTAATMPAVTTIAAAMAVRRRDWSRSQ
jgi:hypothetical protein